MTAAEYRTQPDPLELEHQQRAALWLGGMVAGQEAQDAALWENWRWYQGQGGSLRGFAAAYEDSGQTSFGSLVNRLDREQARRAGFAGTLTEQQHRGKLLRGGSSAEQVQRLEAEAEGILRRKVPDPTERELRDARIRALTATASRERAEVRETFQQAQERTRALVREAVPTAPAAPLEADTLNLQALEVLAAARPQEYRAALEVAQTGDLSGFDAHAARPVGYGDWLKQHGHCWVSGRLPVGGEVFDLHHVAYGDYEARRGDGGPQILCAVARENHIPQPFSDRETAHSKAWTVGHDPARLIALLEYQARQWARYQAFIRGESDPAESENP